MGQDTSSWLTSLSQIGPWIISGIALLQFWVAALWRKWRKPVIEVHPSGNIEIGYGSFGPSIGIIGTLRTIHKDIFVRNIYLKVVKKKDESTHSFNWRAFRSITISTTPSDVPSLEIASSFLLTEKNPYKFNIFFVDEVFIAEISPQVGGMPQKWSEFRNNELREIAPDSAIVKNPMIEEEIYDKFSKSKQITDEYSILDRAFYWEAGEYSLDIVVNTTKPAHKCFKKFRFSLTETDVKQLRLNTIGIIRYLCGFKVILFFAYPKFIEP